MSNANTEHSKKQRAESAKKAMQKRLADPNYKQISIGGDRATIEQFEALLKATGKTKRIEQLAELLKKLG